ncbi:MAG: putative serine protease [Myxococcales bacterium]|nr:putative serine protease [Myxococcales bacterium]
MLDRVPWSPLRMCLVACLGIGASLTVRCLDADDPHTRERVVARAEDAVQIHVKLAPITDPAARCAWCLTAASASVAVASATLAVERDLGFATNLAPMFTSLPAGATDARARWITLTAPSRAAADVILARLAADAAVDQAFIAPAITLPTGELSISDLAGPDLGRTELSLITDATLGYRMALDESCPITTPSFESYQGYLGPAPHGIDAPAAWRRGHRGAGVWFADIEGGWNADHEDLPGDRITHAGGLVFHDPAWRAHGTAVLGEVVGRDNGKGVVGIAPDVDRVFTSSIGGTTVANAIDVAASKLRPGDVLLIELQGGGPRGRWIPVEYWDDVFDTIQVATRRGVIVIEAAGNGAEDLDHKIYKRKFERATRDSGAIMVGAGGPPRGGFDDRERLDFSNYGARVDVQGWGRKVATLDYGDLQACSGADRHYTGEFSGTSSASPIVAGAAVIVQSVAKTRGTLLSPREVRDLLHSTGTPQAGDTREQIGPRPDLERAISAIDR